MTWWLGGGGLLPSIACRIRFFHHIQSFDYRFCWSGCPHTFRLLFTWIRVHAQHCQLHFSHSSIAFPLSPLPLVCILFLCPLVDVSKRLHNAMIVSIVDFPSSWTYIPLAISAGVGPTSPFCITGRLVSLALCSINCCGTSPLTWEWEGWTVEVTHASPSHAQGTGIQFRGSSYILWERLCVLTEMGGYMRLSGGHAVCSGAGEGVALGSCSCVSNNEVVLASFGMSLPTGGGGSHCTN